MTRHEESMRQQLQEFSESKRRVGADALARIDCTHTPGIRNRIRVRVRVTLTLNPNPERLLPNLGCLKS